tara:strand:+ start:20682 stop:21743 length:1062 start_codon:yes stop_codon:yes gene_type:complete
MISVSSEKLGQWLKKNLFSTPMNSVVSIILITILFKVSVPFIQWLLIDSVWSGTAADCRQAEGACLAFIREKSTFILFGFYPRELLWRPITTVLLFIAMVWYSKEPKRWNSRLLWRWVKFLLLAALLMRGGMFGFEAVEIEKWGGLPLTLMLAFFGIIFSYPMGILLALGRRSHMPIIKSSCVIYIELIRGVPLISLLFMASVMMPFFLPDGLILPKIIRAQLAIILFMAAYMSEVIRGGLASLSKGQYEAADALGLTYWQKMIFIILPQALKVVIPPTVNTMIGMFKDTSLVLIIALFDLLMTTKSALNDASWLGFSVEAYLFVAVIYFIFCFSMGKYSRRLELEFDKGRRA